MRLATAALAALLICSSLARAQSPFPSLDQEPACQSLMPSAAGGPMPRNPDIVVLRFLGVSNYELAYRDQVVLLDAAIDELAYWAPNGLKPADMTKHLNAVFVGHAHGEHVWDAPYLGEHTKALIVSDPISYRWIRGTGQVPDGQLKVAKGGETFKLPGVTVNAVLAHHNIVPNSYLAKDRAAAAAITLKPAETPEEQAHDRRLGGMVPLDAEERASLITENTIAYFFTFDNGFTMFYTDSGGPTTEAEREIMFGKKGIDIGLLPYYGLEIAPPITMEYIRLFNPAVMMPTHHDGHRNRMLDMPMGPLGLDIRDAGFKTKLIAPLLRAPVCMNTVTKEVYVGN
jgi:L-ascorbate metabolism protein UlaG (beta-lactamase superfamily)